MSVKYNPANGEEILCKTLPPDYESDDGLLELPLYGGDDESTDDESLEAEYVEMQKDPNCQNGCSFHQSGGGTIKEKFDNAVVTPFLFSRFLDKKLNLDQVAQLGHPRTRRKLYRKLTNVFKY